jgi:hypothetical protein
VTSERLTLFGRGRCSSCHRAATLFNAPEGPACRPCLVEEAEDLFTPGVADGQEAR